MYNYVVNKNQSKIERVNSYLRNLLIENNLYAL